MYKEFNRSLRAPPNSSKISIRYDYEQTTQNSEKLIKRT